MKAKFLIVILTLLSSCKITQEDLWGPKFYNETFREFSISAENKEVILVGSKYHYLLEDESELLKNVITSPLSNQVSLGGNNLRASASNKLSFELGIMTSKIDTMSKSEIKFFENLKFSKSKTNSEPARNTLRESLDLNGERYIPAPNNTYKTEPLILAKEFSATIWEERTKPETATKILLTPFAVIADILMAPFYLIGVIGMASSQ